VLNVSGVAELQAALEAMTVRLQVATPEALHQGAMVLEGKTRANLSRTSHARGTLTPSRPGQPPSLIDGRLRNSVTSTPPVPAGERWACIVGATTVYARIQEIGGWAGRGHASYLPPRPYLRPAAEALAADPAYAYVFERAWGRALRA
jgi:phage gpG-like protein